MKSEEKRSRGLKAFKTDFNQSAQTTSPGT